MFNRRHRKRSLKRLGEGALGQEIRKDGGGDIQWRSNRAHSTGEKRKEKGGAKVSKSNLQLHEGFSTK